MREIYNIINGKVIKSGSGRFAPVYNPSTGEQIAKLNLSLKSEVGEAIGVAKQASEEWGNAPPLKRTKRMFKFKQLLDENSENIAETISEEQGKTYEDALGEVSRGIDVVDFACGIPNLLKGDYSRNVSKGIDTHTLRQPIGVCAGITPLNFPFMVPLWMYPLAIACGNAFILKPSEKDPSTSMLAHDLFQAAGFPDGVLNVVHGDKEAVDAILHHPDVGAVSFVGSTPIARYIYKEGAANNKRVQALGGAKNHMVIMPDADLEQAVDALLGAAYGAAGERCMAISVAVAVGNETADRLVEKLKPKVKALKIGAFGTRGLDMGPLITKEHLDKVKSYVDIGVAEGAALVVDGRDFYLENNKNGYFLGACLFDNVSPGMRIAKEEIFGPVLCVIRAASYDEAVDIIQNHEYGNGTAIFTRDGDTARNFSDTVNVGMVGINVPIPVPVAFHSFGGWKNSLFGDYSVYGQEGINFFTRLKTVTSRWPSGIRSGAEYSFPSLK